MAAVDGSFHYQVLLAAFQFAAAGVIWRSSRAGRVARSLAALLLALNAGISVAAAFALLEPSPIWERVGWIVDAPTPEVLVALALWFPRPRGHAWARGGASGLLFLAAVAACVTAATTPDPNGLMWDLFTLVATLAAYSAAVALYARDFARTGSVESQWMLAAFGIRAAEFAVYFTRFGEWTSPVTWLLDASLLVALVWLARAGPAPRAQRGLLVGILATGLAIGALRRWVTPDTGLPESLVTLGIARPVLMVLAMTPRGTVGSFFASCGVAFGAYLGVVASARAAGLSFAGSRLAELVLGLAAATSGWGAGSWAVSKRSPAVVAAPVGHLEVAARRRLLLALAAAPPAVPLSRRELAERIGILPRNVHRLVLAVNRGTPDRPLVTWRFERGRGNQKQFHYALTDVGRRFAEMIAERSDEEDRQDRPTDRRGEGISPE